jgi:multimeric flavodoxin WrbA
MKIVSINASPNKNGSTSTLLGCIENNLSSMNHDIKRYDLYDLQFEGCIGCSECSKPETHFCAQNDDLIKVLEDIDKADSIIFGSPVYVGFITGVGKSFIDRLYTFLKTEEKSERLKNKIFTSVITQGGDIKYFQSVREYFKEWFIDYIGMKDGGSMVAAGLGSVDDLQKQPEPFTRTKEIAQKINSFMIDNNN